MITPTMIQHAHYHDVTFMRPSDRERPYKWAVIVERGNLADGSHRAMLMGWYMQLVEARSMFDHCENFGYTTHIVSVTS